MWQIISHWIGVDNLAGPQYGFWSGFGSDLTEFALLGTLVGLYRQHNCHVKGCLRLSHFPVQGTHYKTCHKHLTAKDHASLITRHATNHPEQHKMLGKK